MQLVPVGSLVSGFRISDDEAVHLSVVSLPPFLRFPLSLSGFHLAFYSRQIYLCVQLKIVDRNSGLLRHLPLNKENKRFQIEI